MVLVENAAGFHDVELVDGALVPGHIEHPIEVVPYPACLRVLLAGPLEPVELALDFLTDGVGHASVFDLLAIFGGNVAVAFAEFLLDRFELLAQQELALPLLHPFLDLAPDFVLERSVGENLASPGDQRLEPGFNVERLQDLDLTLQRKVGRVARQVGELTRTIDAAHHLDDLTGAAQLEQVLDEGLVLAGQDMRALGQRVDVVGRLGQHPQRRAGTGGRTTDGGPVQPLENGDLDAVWQFPRILEFGDRANAGVAAFDSGNEQHEAVALARGGDGGLSLVALQRDSHHHVRQHHPVVERQEGDEISF